MKLLMLVAVVAILALPPLASAQDTPTTINQVFSQPLAHVSATAIRLVTMNQWKITRNDPLLLIFRAKVNKVAFRGLALSVSYEETPSGTLVQVVPERLPFMKDKGDALARDFLKQLETQLRATSN